MKFEEALFYLRDGQTVVSRHMRMRFHMVQRSVLLASSKKHWFIEFQHIGTKFPDDWIRWHSAPDDVFDLINDDTWEVG